MKTSSTKLALLAAAACAAMLAGGAVPPAVLANLAEHMPLSFYAMPAKPKATKVPGAHAVAPARDERLPERVRRVRVAVAAS